MDFILAKKAQKHAKNQKRQVNKLDASRKIWLVTNQNRTKNHSMFRNHRIHNLHARTEHHVRRGVEIKMKKTILYTLLTIICILTITATITAKKPIQPLTNENKPTTIQDNKEYKELTLLSPSILENKTLKVRGRTQPYTKVEVKIGTHKKKTKTDPNGNFETTIGPINENFSTIHASTSLDNNYLESNLEFPLHVTGEKKAGENWNVKTPEIKEIQKINISLKENCSPFLLIENTNQKLTKLDNNAEKVYRIFRVSSNLVDNSIRNASFLIKVSKLWIKNEEINSTKIKAIQFENQEINNLNTNLVKEDEKFLYFSVNTEKFSNFGIIGVKNNKNFEKINSSVRKDLFTDNTVFILFILTFSFFFIIGLLNRKIQKKNSKKTMHSQINLKSFTQEVKK